MKVLWIFAHPEAGSLNGSLRDEGVRALREQGHEVRESDLYAMGWKATVDRTDVAFDSGGDEDGGDGRMVVGDAQEAAYRAGTLSPDIRAEQEKLDWADTVVLHFPLWWFGPPAILKGWFDRVLVQGYAQVVTDAEGRTRRYGDGGLAGKRALVVTSVGARESSFGPRGVHGDLNGVLFPVHHGVFWYTGMEALPPFAVYGANRRFTERDFKEYADALRARLEGLESDTPLPFRREAGGDYDADLVLRADVAPGRTGIDAHYDENYGAHYDENVPSVPR
ncbi:NAD(P)H-dependent oxidoreductase [Streptomyces sp. NPDC048172]|uniref:NAD(P)H-dependent oxidoreductase n=1 Tax=Streptomyces sp. NPDC048172 TaxID=3365505 RepID=UPI0037226E61